MRARSFALLIWAGLAPGALAQAIPDPPAQPLWQRLYSHGDGQIDMLETTTAGRVGDTGYVWRGRFSMYDYGPELVHTSIDCPSGRIHEDGAAMYSSAPELAFVEIQRFDNSYAPRDAGEQRMVDAVCSGKPLALSPVLYGLAAADAYVKTGIPGAEPGVDPQFVLPQAMVLDHAGRLENGRHIFIETTTAGRVGEKGYVWELNAPPSPAAGEPVFQHWTIDCPTLRVDANWEIRLDPDHLIARQRSLAGWRFGVLPDTPVGDAIKAVCAGGPVSTGGQRFDTLDGALAMAAAGESQPAAPLPRLPAGVDATMLPPVMDISLVEIFAATDIAEPFKVYLEENWLSNSALRGMAWLFFSGVNLKSRDGTPMSGFWSEIEYDCNPPYTGRVRVEAALDAKGQIIDIIAQSFQPQALPRDSYYFAGLKAACDGKLPPAERQRFTTTAEAAADAQP